MTVEQVVGIFVAGGVVITLLISVMSGAFVAGKHSNRIASLEDRQEKAEAEVKTARTDANKTTVELAGLKATVEALDRAVHGGFERLEKAVENLTPRGRRNSGTGD